VRFHSIDKCAIKLQIRRQLIEVKRSLLSSSGETLYNQDIQVLVGIAHQN